MILDKYFIENVSCCLESKKEFEGYMDIICDYLTSISPSDYNYFYRNNGFICVNVPFEDVNDYISFFDELIGCKYTYSDNLNGVCLMISLSTLNDSI